MSIVFEDLGIALCHQKITPGNTATGFSAGCYTYTQYRLDFDDGDTELTAGSWIVGATSGAVARIFSVHADTTTWTNNTGYVIVDSWNGTAFQDNEEIKQAATATAANVNGVLKERSYFDYANKGLNAKAVVISVISNTALVSWTGATPDQTSLIGHSFIANSSYTIKGYENIKNFKGIDYTASSASTINATFYF